MNNEKTAPFVPFAGKLASYPRPKLNMLQNILFDLLVSKVDDLYFLCKRSWDGREIHFTVPFKGTVGEFKETFSKVKDMCLDHGADLLHMYAGNDSWNITIVPPAQKPTTHEIARTLSMKEADQPAESDADWKLSFLNG